MNLNRQQRRKMGREKDVAAKTISKFSSKEIEIIDSITNAKADEKFKEKMQEVEAIMSRCVSAYFIELFQNKTWQDIFEMESNLAELMVEDTEKWRKLLEGKDERMGKKILKELEEKVRNSARELIEKDVKQKESIEILVTSYPTLSRACITTAYKKVKSELGKDKATDLEVEKAVEKIWGADKVEGTDNLDKDIAKTGLSDNSNVDTIIKSLDSELNREGKEERKVSNLRVVKKVLEVEGEFGTYTVNETGVTTGYENFKSLDDLKQYKEKEMATFLRRCEEIEEVFNLV